MSDIMLFGVLRMPYEMAMGDEMSRLQFYDRAQEAADRLESAIPADVGRRAMEALTNVCKNFPTDFDMADLGWDSLTVEAACTAYDKARASITELQQALAAPPGGQRE